MGGPGSGRRPGFGGKSFRSKMTKIQYITKNKNLGTKWVSRKKLNADIRKAIKASRKSKPLPLHHINYKWSPY